MSAEKNSIDYEIYQPIFMDHGKLSSDELFAGVPYSHNLLLDIYMRIRLFPFFFRKKYQEKFNWTLTRFYRKMGNPSDYSGIIYSELKFGERKKALLLAIDCLQMFINYLKCIYRKEL